MKKKWLRYWRDALPFLAFGATDALTQVAAHLDVFNLPPEWRVLVAAAVGGAIRMLVQYQKAHPLPQ